MDILRTFINWRYGLRFQDTQAMDYIFYFQKLGPVQESTCMDTRPRYNYLDKKSKSSWHLAATINTII